MYLIVIKNEGTIHKKMNGPKNIQCEKWFFIVVNRLLEYVLQKVLHFYLSTYKFFMITCEMKTKANFYRDKNTFRSFLQFALLMSLFLCLQIKSATDSEAQKAKTARGVKKSEETGVCCKVNSMKVSNGFLKVSCKVI